MDLSDAAKCTKHADLSKSTEAKVLIHLSKSSHQEND